MAELFGNFDEEEDAEEEPDAKRARANTVGDVVEGEASGTVIKSNRVCWADVSDEDSDDRKPAPSRVCDHCDRHFGTRNGLFDHLRTVGRAPERGKSYAQAGSMFSDISANHQGNHN